MTTIPDDMVERVARAICECSGQPWSHSGDGYREICSDFARAAIEAMQPAILAERERCAKVAETFALVAHPDTTNQLYHSVEYRLRSGPFIAAAIRSQL